MAEKHIVTRERFNSEVQRCAYTIWQSREYSRRFRNWMQAIRDLGYKDHIFSNDPRRQTVKAQTEQIYLERKDADALLDWTDAEQQVLTFYQITE